MDLHDPEAEQYGGKRYSRQGERQPFGYTGYRHDDISGTYFAQAREYQPAAGRFVAEDVIHGRNTVPKTLNRYGYCWGNPIGYIDVNGKFPETQDEMWQEFLEYYFGGLKEVFDNKWDSFNRDIQEKYEEIKKEAGNFLENTKNAAKNAGDFAMDKINKGAYWIRDTTDSAMDTINDGVHWAKDTLSEHPGSIATGADLSITGSIVQQDFMLGPTLCTNGDLGIQFTYSLGITLWSNTCSAAYMRYLTITNAPSLEALEGDGFNVGGSYMFPIEEVIVALGLDVNVIGRNAEYLGLTATAGLGLGSGPEVHGQVGYTHTLWKVNLFDEWDKFYSKYKEKRCESVK